MPRPSNKEKLLRAAVQVAVRDGAAHLTLDAVAAEAGVSKGGLLYHFASKDALLRGLLFWELDGFDSALEERIKAGSNGAATPAAGAFLRAYLALSLETQPQRVPVNLLAAYAFEAPVLAEVASRLRRWQQRAIQDLPGVLRPQALTLLLAADGAWLSGWLGMPIDPEQAAALLAQAERLSAQEEHP